MTTIALPATIRNAAQSASFHLQTQDSELPNNAGVSQITSYPNRRWVLHLEVIPVSGADLRAWALALNRLAMKANVFAYGPPYYTGPSTGYAGATPLVAGADQTGTSLDVDGLDNSSDILLAGDFISFDTTSAGGETNRQLIPVTGNVSSNGSGEATIELAYPIRNAPANNASVNISTPTAFFALTGNRGGLDHIDGSGFGRFTIDAEERIWP